MKKAAIFLVIVLLLAGVMLQWGLDRTPAGTDSGDDATFPQASSLLDLLGGARQYLAYTFYIKADEISHAYYGSFDQEAELLPYFLLITQLNPNYISAYRVASGILEMLGDPDEAIDIIRRGLRANPESADLYYDLAALLMYEGHYKEASGALEKGLQFEPEFVTRNMMLTSLAAAYSALGDHDSQVRVLMEKAIQNEIALAVDDLTYDQKKGLVELINITLNEVTDARGQ